jgi:hypothetical protein
MKNVMSIDKNADVNLGRIWFNIDREK